MLKRDHDKYCKNNDLKKATERIHKKRTMSTARKEHKSNTRDEHRGVNSGSHMYADAKVSISHIYSFKLLIGKNDHKIIWKTSETSLTVTVDEASFCVR